MRNTLLTLTTLCCVLLVEVNAQTKVKLPANIIYIGGGRQGTLYAKYERILRSTDWTKTIVNIGFGGIPGDAEYGEPRTNKIMPEIGQLFGWKTVFIEIGIEPSINFYGDVTYTDINGIAGLRYQKTEAHTLFFQAGYNPRLYTTYDSNVEVPIYFGLGMVF